MQRPVAIRSGPLKRPSLADLDAARRDLVARRARVEVHAAILETLRQHNQATRDVEERLAIELKVLELMQAKVDAIADALFSAD